MQSLNASSAKTLEYISASPGSLSLFIGDTANIVVTAHYNDNSTEVLNNPDVIWASSMPSTVAVEQGTVRGISQGSAVVNATYSGKAAAVLIDVVKQKDGLAALSIEPEVLELQEGATGTLTLTAKYNDGTSRVVTGAEWFSSIKAFATVLNGEVTAKQTGTTIISAKYQDRVAYCTVNVTPDGKGIKELKAYPDSAAIKIGDSKLFYISATRNDGVIEDVTDLTTWKSNNTEVAVVDSGKVIGVAQGKAVITAGYGGKEVQIPVDISTNGNPLENISVTPENLALEVDGKDVQINVYITDNNGKKTKITDKCTYLSLNTKIVTVSSKGKATPKGKGETRVTVTYNNRTLEIPVVVNPKLSKITVDTGTLKIKKGKDTDITVTAVYSDGKKEDVTETATIKSSNTKICKVNDGVLEGVAKGTAKITVTFGSLKKTLSINVY
ncbi:bacterial Ig-like domain protein [Desulfocucumis palustris]|uniref:Bacterial Ig-like domain protein n=1 Tax=Desulfocucumis palustris TaxID=1898651 RepID=A0A2L2XG87_9FIRM|nr:bacterial Ig-like domain protein [Desulfocucumis palustris]